MNSNVLIINHGAAIAVSSGSNDLYTITLRQETTYCKLRNIGIQVFTGTPPAGTSLTDLYLVGRRGYSLLIRASQTMARIRAFEDMTVQAAALQAVQCHFLQNSLVEKLVITPDFFTEHPEYASLKPDILSTLRNSLCKIACTMLHPGDLHVVAKLVIGTGAAKTVQKIISLWQQNPVRAGTPVVHVFAKPRKGLDPNPMKLAAAMCRWEAHCSKLLTSVGAPHILPIQELPRSARKKVRLIMEYCPLGNAAQYARTHFDLVTHRIFPQFRNEHLDLAIQLGETLSRMHGQGIIHGDLKLENVLLKYSSGGTPQIVLSDFGLTTRCGTYVHFCPGTYPPPEALETIERWRSEHTEMFQSMGPLRITQDIDVWAYAICLFALMHDEPQNMKGAEWSQGSAEIRQAVGRLVSMLDPADPVDRILRRQFDRNPKVRAPVSTVTDELKKLYHNGAT